MGLAKDTIKKVKEAKERSISGVKSLIDAKNILKKEKIKYDDTEKTASDDVIFLMKKKDVAMWDESELVLIIL